MGNKYSLGVYGTFDFRKNKLSIIHVQNLCFSESCFSEHKLCWSWVTFIKYILIWWLKKSIIFPPRGAIYDRYHITKSLKKNYKDLTVRVSCKGSLPWQKVITPKLAKIAELQNIQCENQIFFIAAQLLERRFHAFVTSGRYLESSFHSLWTFNKELTRKET